MNKKLRILKFEVLDGGATDKHGNKSYKIHVYNEPENFYITKSAKVASLLPIPGEHLVFVEERPTKAGGTYFNVTSPKTEETAPVASKGQSYGQKSPQNEEKRQSSIERQSALKSAAQAVSILQGIKADDLVPFTLSVADDFVSWLKHGDNPDELKRVMDNAPDDWKTDPIPDEVREQEDHPEAPTIPWPDSLEEEK